MRFLSVREFRGKSGQIWKQVAKEKEMVITSNGKPVAILSAVGEDNLEAALAAIRRARAMQAVEAMQSQFGRTGRDRPTARDVEREIAQVRRGRAK